ncbi:MAG: carotenoid oxygenase family protein [Myxococcales bacterium]
MIDNVSRFQGINPESGSGTLGSAPLSGRLARAPFRWTRRDQTSLPVTLEGKLPEWLKGDLVRTAPAVFELGGWRAQHWFDGLGILFGFSFGEGVSFKQRLLASEALRDAQGERFQVASFSTPTRRSWWQRVIKPIAQITDNANVNVVPWQGAWLAMTESPHQHLIDGQSLATRGLYRYEDKLPVATLSAHPHFDFGRKALVNVASSFGPKNVLRVYSQASDSRTRKVEGELVFKRVPYLHSFGLSPRHAVIIDHPYKVNPLKLLFSNRAFIDPFEWEPSRGTKLWKLDRASGRWSAYHTEPLFCFHTANCFDDGDDVVLDFVAYDNPDIVQLLKTESLDRSVPAIAPRFVRARLKPGRRDVELEPLSQQGFEFPSIAYRTDNGHAYSSIWGTRLAQGAQSDVDSEVVRVEIGRGEVATFTEPHVTYGEPLFVARPGATRSDDGVILCLGSHAEQERATLAVLDATTLEPVARAHVDACLPLGFHGNFLAARS